MILFLDVVAPRSKFVLIDNDKIEDIALVYGGVAAMIKRADSTGDWPVKDKARSPDNEAHETLYANTTAANFGMGLDILSNGFKPKTSDATINASGGVYIFMAFAENPFGGEDVSPATAR